MSYASELAMDTFGENCSTHLSRRGLSGDELPTGIVPNQLVDQTCRFPSPASAHDERPGTTVLDDLDFLRRCTKREFSVRAVCQKTVHDRLRELEESVCHGVSTKTLRAGIVRN